MHLVLTRTRLGLAIRAVAQDPETASAMGIRFTATVLATFAIGSALAALAGVVNGLYYNEINFNLGLLLGVIGFSAAVIGGLGNVYGAILGGFLFAALQTIGAVCLADGERLQGRVCVRGGHRADGGATRRPARRTLGRAGVSVSVSPDARVARHRRRRPRPVLVPAACREPMGGRRHRRRGRRGAPVRVAGRLDRARRRRAARPMRAGRRPASFIAVAVIALVLREHNFALLMLCTVMLYVVAGLGLTLQFGYAGVVNFAGAAFFGIGAYAAAVLATQTVAASRCSCCCSAARAPR